ncbi:CapA family protein [Chloroflexota bacterium]
MSSKTLTMLAVGDIILDEPEPDSFFSLSTPVLKSANVVVGHVEVAFTSRGIDTYKAVPAPPIDPARISALPSAGFNVATLAANHLWDSGAPGVEDTISGLRGNGIAVAGAGMNIDEARHPVIIERDGTRFGFLSYNCVGPQDTWATPHKPGCAYVEILSHYDMRMGHSTAYTFAESTSLEAMIDDIRKLRPDCDVLVVALHKGLANVPIKLAMYEQPVSYAAIEAGADLILGHHAHILHGIEQYRGKIIFHSLCNFVAATRALTVDGAPNARLKEYAKQRLERLGFKLDPEYPTYPFHPEAKQTIIAKCTIDGGKISRVSYLPCMINKKAQPEILKNDERGQQVFDYMEKITRAAGLNARYEWDGDEVLIHGN